MSSKRVDGFLAGAVMAFGVFLVVFGGTRAAQGSGPGWLVCIVGMAAIAVGAVGLAEATARR